MILDCEQCHGTGECKPGVRCPCREEDDDAEERRRRMHVVNDGKDEVGRRLAIEELKVKTVVCLGKLSRPNVVVTCWVQLIDREFVAFQMSNVTLLAVRRPDGTLCDDTGIELQVFEYLGEV